MSPYFIVLELWHNLLKEPGERLHDWFWEMPGSDTSHIHIPWTSIFYLNRFPISAGFFHSLNLYFSETWLPPGPVCFPLGKVALIVVTCFSPPPLGGDCTVEVIFVMTNSKYNTGAHFFFNRCPTLELTFANFLIKLHSGLPKAMREITLNVPILKPWTGQNLYLIKYIDLCTK